MAEKVPPIDVETAESIEDTEAGKNDHSDPLPLSNGSIYTEAASSSSFQLNSQDNQECARQSILQTLMSHLKQNPPADVSKWAVYRNYADKFSASISYKTYRDFERNVF